MTAARVRTWLLRGWVALVLDFLTLPAVVIALASFSRTSYLTVPPRGLTLRWFAAVLGDAEYVHAIGFSVVLRTRRDDRVGRGRGGRVVRADPAAAWPAAPGSPPLLNAPLVFPGVVVGVALLQFYAMVHAERARSSGWRSPTW